MLQLIKQTEMAINFGFNYFDGVMSLAKKQMILSNLN